MTALPLPDAPGAWADPDPRDLLPEALRRRLRDRAMSVRALALAVHANERTVGFWVRGQAAPMVQHAAPLADALASEYIGQLVLAINRGTCEVCGGTWYRANKGQPRLYCSEQCKWAASDRRRHGRSILASHLTRHRLEQHQVATEAFCLRCEPDGVCRMADCPLRPVSPLPYIPLRGLDGKAVLA